MEHYIEILKGLLTPLVAVIALYIAYQQYRTNKSRELRDSRKAKLDVYKKTERFIYDVVHNGAINQNLFEEFTDAATESKFLFPDELSDWLEELHEDAESWFSHERQISKILKDENISRSEFDKNIANNALWQQEEHYVEVSKNKIFKAYAHLKDKFFRYLKL